MEPNKDQSKEEEHPTEPVPYEQHGTTYFDVQPPYQGYSLGTIMYSNVYYFIDMLSLLAAILFATTGKIQFENIEELENAIQILKSALSAFNPSNIYFDCKSFGSEKIWNTFLISMADNFLKWGYHNCHLVVSFSRKRNDPDDIGAVALAIGFEGRGIRYVISNDNYGWLKDISKDSSDPEGIYQVDMVEYKLGPNGVLIQEKMEPTNISNFTENKGTTLQGYKFIVYGPEYYYSIGWIPKNIII